MKIDQKYSNIVQKMIVKNINNFIDINNKYKSFGFEILLKDNVIEIIYNNNTYTLQVIKRNKEYYWNLNLLNKNYYRVKIDNTPESLETLIQYIYDNN